MEVLRTEKLWDRESLNCLDWAPEVIGGLELQLGDLWMDIETVGPRYELVDGWLRLAVGMCHEDHMRELVPK